MRLVLAALVSSVAAGCMGSDCCRPPSGCPHVDVVGHLVDGTVTWRAGLGTTTQAPREGLEGETLVDGDREVIVAPPRTHTIFEGQASPDTSSLPLTMHIRAGASSGNLDLVVDLDDVRGPHEGGPPSYASAIFLGACWVRTNGDVSVTVERAVGGPLAGPTMVTADFDRVLRIDFDIAPPLEGTSSQPHDGSNACSLDVTMSGTVRVEVKAADYAYDPKGSCGCPM